MRKTIATLEARRLALQEKLDAGKNRVERNRMGQFATPPDLALEILRYAKAHFGETGTVRFLDPAVGTGSFYSALLNVFPAARIESSVGYEIDPHYGIPAAELWREAGLDVRLEDFTRAIPPSRPERFNLLICNPPYVRHHHIAPGEKQSIQARARDVCGVAINGLAGLYCYFLGLSHAWMEDGGLAGWLVPSVVAEPPLSSGKRGCSRQRRKSRAGPASFSAGLQIERNRDTETVPEAVDVPVSREGTGCPRRVSMPAKDALVCAGKPSARPVRMHLPAGPARKTGSRSALF